MMYPYSFPIVAGGRRALAGLLLWLAAYAAQAQAPGWQAALAVPTSGARSFSYVSATATDAQGNVYVAGDFVGSIVLGGTTLTSIGSRDGFVAKWSPASSSFVWARRLGSTREDYVRGLALRGSDVYVAGSFYGPTADFGTSTLTNADNSGNSDDVFVTKLADAGTSTQFVWAQRAGGTGEDNAFAVAVSGTNVYVAGSFQTTAGFGSATLTSAGNLDLFVAKLTDAGSTSSFTWAQRAGGSDNDAATALAVRGTAVYLTGAFSGTAAFGGATLSSAGEADAFVAKLTDTGTSGTFAWTQRAGGTADDYALRLVDAGGNLYVAGYFESAAANFGAATLASAGGVDVFVTKLADAGASGSFTWAQRAGGAGDDGTADEILTLGLAVRGAHVYLTGAFDGATAEFGGTTLTNAGPANTLDVYAAKLLDDGPTSRFVWAQRAGGASDDGAITVAIHGTTVYVGGLFSPPATFGSQTLTAAADAAAFLASFTDQSLPTVPALAAASVAVAPNPAHARTLVRLPAVPGAGPATLTLFDALGRAVRTRPVASLASESAIEVPLLGLAPGLYRVQVQLGRLRVSRPLLVE